MVNASLKITNPEKCSCNCGEMISRVTTDEDLKGIKNATNATGQD